MLNLGLTQTWIGNGFLNLFHTNNHVFANGVEANNNLFYKNLVFQVRHKNIASCGNMLCWFVLIVWLWVGHKSYHN